MTKNLQLAAWIVALGLLADLNHMRFITVWLTVIAVSAGMSFLDWLWPAVGRLYEWCAKPHDSVVTEVAAGLTMLATATVIVGVVAMALIGLMK
jgi:hypothetical protein